MQNVRKVCAFFCATGLLLLTSCGGPRDQIVGKWQAQGEAGVVWEFSKNGVVRTGNTSGRYSFGDRGRIKIQTPSATFVYELAIKDDTMTWKDPSGARIELKRAP